MATLTINKGEGTMNEKLKHIIDCGVWVESLESLAFKIAYVQDNFSIDEEDLILHLEIIMDYLKGGKSYSLYEL